MLNKWRKQNEKVEKTGKKSENNSQHRQYYEEKLYTLLEKSVAIGNNKTDIVEQNFIHTYDCIWLYTSHEGKRHGGDVKTGGETWRQSVCDINETRCMMTI